MTLDSGAWVIIAASPISGHILSLNRPRKEISRMNKKRRAGGTALLESTPHIINSEMSRAG